MTTYNLIPEYNINPNVPSKNLLYENEKTPQEVILVKYNYIPFGNEKCFLHSVSGNPFEIMKFLTKTKRLNSILITTINSFYYNQLIKEYRIKDINVKSEQMYLTNIHYKNIDINICIVNDLSNINDILHTVIIKGYESICLDEVNDFEIIIDTTLKIKQQYITNLKHITWCIQNNHQLKWDILRKCMDIKKT